MVSALVADLFESRRPHLFSLAYRATGSVAEAESAVQETWLRLSVARQSAIADLSSWLAVVTGEICLDQLRRIAIRRADRACRWLPEPIVTAVRPAIPPDPMEAVVRKPDCRFATMLALELLTPPQRLAHVLHDGSEVPFAEIADMLGLSPADAEESAATARDVLAGAPAPVSDPEHERAVLRLLAALAADDLDAVQASLHPAAEYGSDVPGAARAAAPSAADTARLVVGLLHTYGPNLAPNSTEYEFVRVNGQLGLLLHERASHDGHPGTPARVFCCTVVGGRVRGVYDLADPADPTGLRVP